MALRRGKNNQRQPVPTGTRTIERQYYRLMRQYQLAYRQILEEEISDTLPRLREQAKQDLPAGVRLDDFNDDIERMFDRALRRLNAKFPPETLKAWGKGVAVAISGLSKRNVTKMVKTEFDADPVFNDAGELAPYLSNRVSENVALIQSIPRERRENFQNMLIRNVNDGTPVRDVVKQVRKEFQKTQNRAQLLARDQINKLNGEITQFRLRKIGVQRYIWRTVGDERVRSRHAAVNGKMFKWDDPPAVGVNGQKVNPGQDIQCRCYAEPVLDDVTG